MFEHSAFERRGPGTKVNSWPDENRSLGPVHVLFEEWPRRISDRSMPSCSIGAEPWPNHRATKLLIDLISGFALSCDIGVAEPHPMMFQAALDMVAVSPERCLMVGDNRTPDTGA